MKLVSILGDSVSTFEGYNPPDYAVFYDKVFQRRNGLQTVYDTWWAKVNQALNAFLCINNSYSGSRISGQSFPSAVSEERLNNLCNSGYSPDFILIYMGFNDFGYGVKISKPGTDGIRDADLSFFSDAYEYLLCTLRRKYPDSRIVCGTLMRTFMKNQPDWDFPEYYAGIEFEKYNNVIRSAAAKSDGSSLADLSAQGKRYETLDGTHPTIAGHQTLAEAWISSLADLDLLKPSIESCIKMYRSNKDSDSAVYMIFEALMRERVLLPVNECGKLVGLPVNYQTIIPIFTSPNEISKEEPVRLKPVFLSDNLDALMSAGLNLIVNPFSQADRQFIIPYPLIDKILRPLAETIKKT